MYTSVSEFHYYADIVMGHYSLFNMTINKMFIPTLPNTDEVVVTVVLPNIEGVVVAVPPNVDDMVLAVPPNPPKSGALALWVLLPKIEATVVVAVLPKPPNPGALGV